MSNNPLVAPPYVAGTLTISAQNANVPQSLLALIQAQLEPNASGAYLGVTIFVATGEQTLYIGGPSSLGNALSTTNFGYQLVAGASSYRMTAGAGQSPPLGQVQVLATASTTFHVELF